MDIFWLDSKQILQDIWQQLEVIIQESNFITYWLFLVRGHIFWRNETDYLLGEVGDDRRLATLSTDMKFLFDHTFFKELRWAFIEEGCLGRIWASIFNAVIKGDANKMDLPADIMTRNSTIALLIDIFLRFS
jgi:hypothetical protein